MKWQTFDFKTFKDFYETFQTFIESTALLEPFKHFNFKNKDIEKRFKKIYDKYESISLKKIASLFRTKGGTSLFQISHWTERGWTEEEAKRFVSEYQSKNGAKFSEKLKNDPSIRLTSSQLEYWLKKGLSEEEAKEKLAERQSTFSLEKCIEKYGEKEGTKRFKERQEKWQRTINERFSEEEQYRWRIMGGARFSKAATNMFQCAYNIYKNRFKCYLAPYTKEYFLRNNSNFWKYDFSIPELNLIFEYNGETFHANPEWPEEKLRKWVNPLTKENAQENIEKNKRKIQDAKDLGFDIYIIWSSENVKEAQKRIMLLIEDKIQTLGR